MPTFLCSIFHTIFTIVSMSAFSSYFTMREESCVVHVVIFLIVHAKWSLYFVLLKTTLSLLNINNINVTL